jgi:hypothetical protein
MRLIELHKKQIIFFYKAPFPTDLVLKVEVDKKKNLIHEIKIISQKAN